jgi:calcium/calmodulin-dependent protein kinase I
MKSRSPSPTPSKENGDSGVEKDVALKVIPKKKVKGNEASVWGEMEVLKGLDHPNIVSGRRGFFCVFLIPRAQSF